MVDFDDLLTSTTIEEVAHGYLGLKVTEVKGRLRAQCSICGGDSRKLSITPSSSKNQGWFICFGSKNPETGKYNGGDLISLVSHCHGISMKEAAEALAKVYMDEAFQAEEPESERKAEKRPKVSSNFDPVKYARDLNREQEDVSEFGILAELCEEVGGMGLSTKGINRGKLVIPLRDENGKFIDYIGVKGDVVVPKKWRVA